MTEEFEKVASNTQPPQAVQNRTENQKPNQKNQTETKFRFFQFSVSVSVLKFRNHLILGFFG